MSMTIFKIAEFVGMFIAYTAVVLLLPAGILRKILKNRSLSERFLICYTFGNFFIINIVFIVQLLHISNIWTLCLLTIGSSLLIWSKVEQVSIKERLIYYGNNNKKLIQRRLGLHTVIHQHSSDIERKWKMLARFLYRAIVKRPIQWLFVMSILGALFWIYGRQIILAYGYRASDIPVHMNWINQMSRGNLFASGVYPFGFHCIIYFLHTVFRIDTYVLMCQFFFVQVIYAHLVGLAVLKEFCKSKYLPYAGVLIYILGNFWANQTYSRYYSTLPQEFGMIFVFPSIYFLIRFFQIKKEDLKEKETFYQLACFAMAFALTLSIHFYGTMIAGIACVGIAFGFIFRFLNKEYFGRIMLTGIISIILAVLPMGIAFATGTPLQGSLGWGMSVIKGSSSESDSSESQTSENHQSTLSEEEMQEVQEIIERYENGESMTEETPKETTEEIVTVVPEEQGIISRLKSLMQMAARQIQKYVIDSEIQFEYAGYLVLIGIAALFPVGILHSLFRHREYGEMLLSVGWYMVLIGVLLCAEKLGLPTLMDPARCSIYFSYLLWLVPILFLDSIIYMFFPLKVLEIPRDILSFGLAGVILVGVFQNIEVKETAFSSGFVTNEAIICLDNIIYENPDWTWTIVSANDEFQMGLDHGWHYEISSFLKGMEYLTSDSKLEIPTKMVYFYIEKIPLNYAEEYENSGQSISRKGASQTLPNVGGIGNYTGENRWIEMSRMYYWAEAFQKMYPNEMQVYYETEEFICYKIEQNTYRLYNFAIDYGYNTVMTED